MATSKISTQQQLKVEAMLVQWKGKLTWQTLIDRVKLEVGISITRQALCSYVGIKDSYRAAKIKLRNLQPRPGLDIIEGLNTIRNLDQLMGQIIILKKNNAEQLRMIERIFSNARAIPGLDLRELIKLRPEDYNDN